LISICNCAISQKFWTYIHFTDPVYCTCFILLLVPPFSSIQPLPSVSQHHIFGISICHIFLNCVVMLHTSTEPSSDWKLKIDFFAKIIIIVLIDCLWLFKSPSIAICRVSYRQMLQFFSHSWSCDQKWATYGQYQNKLSIYLMTHSRICRAGKIVSLIYNILLVARILYSHLKWKIWSFESGVVLRIKS
jgi:heme/copper-type cytochrome/quinol oxidase subunit 4